MSTSVQGAATVLWHLFLRGYSLNQDGIAISGPDGDLSYADLHHKAGVLGQELVKSVGTVPTTVAVMVVPSLRCYVAYLAAASIGATVLPLSPSLPKARIDSIALEVGSVVAFIDSSDDRWLPSSWVILDSVSGRPIRHSQTDAVSKLKYFDPSDKPVPAYVMFTSGSTGRPKGVPVAQSAVASYVAAVSGIVDIGPGDRHSQGFALTFDLSVHEMFLTWNNGGTIVQPFGRWHSLIDRYVNDAELTHLFTVPSATDLLSRGVSVPRPIDRCRWIGFCGEPLSFYQVRIVRRLFPNARIWNLYGPTEVTIACSAYSIPDSESEWPSTSNGTVPIGHIFQGMEWELAPGDAGRSFRELLLRGPQRFAGYLNAADNERAFEFDGSDSILSQAAWYRTGDLVDVENGDLLVHHGRFDDQVKLNGYRVELREIDVAVRELAGVQVSVVVLDSQNEQAPLLRAFYVGDALDTAIARESLRQVLPSYMIPRHFVRLSELPLNVNGKVDRQKLGRWRSVEDTYIIGE